MTTEVSTDHLLRHVEASIRRDESSGRGCVTLAYAQSLDGSIASHAGATTFIGCHQSRVLTHRLRAMHDGVMVGVNTVLVDDPQLTVRHVEGRDPRPVVVDSRLRTPVTAKLLQRGSALIATTPEACSEKARQLESAGAEILHIPSDSSGRVDLAQLFETLAQRGVRSVMVEGGAQIITSILRERLATRMVLTVSPELLGGVRAVGPLTMPAENRPRLDGIHRSTVEGDQIITGELYSPGLSAASPEISADELVFGVLSSSGGAGSELDEKLRDLTVSWSRYSWHDAIIHGSTVAGILKRALDEGYRYCFLQTCGHVIRESWKPFADSGGDIVTFLKRWARQGEFLVSGLIHELKTGSCGLDERCLLVDLQQYHRLGLPEFGRHAFGDFDVSTGTVERQDGRVTSLQPGGTENVCRAAESGAGFLAASLRNGLSVRGFGREMADAALNLQPTNADNAAAFARYLGNGIHEYRAEAADPALTADQRIFLNSLCRQTSNAKKGVFLWNIESYADVDVCGADFPGPVTSLYSVAAGFKANRILHTHGFDERTRVVYFDYSSNALQVRQCLVEEWDGSDYPDFIQYLFQRFPDPQTYYQLWSDVRPADIRPADLETMWSRELERWGGARQFQEHWQASRRLRHTYIHCDIMARPQPLLEQIESQNGAVIWWSNAFFTMFGNWFYSQQQRREVYQNWIGQLATRNPELFLLGADDNNSSVNGIQARSYAASYRDAGGDWQRPCKLHREEIRS